MSDDDFSESDSGERSNHVMNNDYAPEACEMCRAGSMATTEMRRSVESRRPARDGAQMLCGSTEVAKDGIGRVGLAKPWGNRVAVDDRTDGDTLVRSTVGKCCRCALKLESSGEHLKRALRTDKKRSKLGPRSQFGSASRYSFARLFADLVRELFGPTGSCTVYEVCGRKNLGVSNSFLRDAHKRAVIIVKSPVKAMKNSETASGPDELLPRMILDVDVSVSRAILFGRSGPNEVFNVLVGRHC